MFLSSLFPGLGSHGELIRGIFILVDESSSGKLGIYSVGDSSTVAGEPSILGTGDSSPGLCRESGIWYVGNSSLSLLGESASGLLAGDNSRLWGELASASAFGDSC